MISLLMGLLALICDVLSLLPDNTVPGLSTGFLSFVGFVFAVVAIATGNSILKVDPGDKNARAGKTLGLLCIVLGLLGMGLFVAAIAGCVACISCM